MAKATAQAAPEDLDLVAEIREGRASLRMKVDADFEQAAEVAYSVTAQELRAFVERIEALEAEKRERSDAISLVYSEAKGRGYDAKVLRKLIARRKRKPDDLAEEEAVLGTYEAALGALVEGES